VISGTQTGGVAETTPGQYTRLTGWDVAANRVCCRGPVKASSESLTHAMLYDLMPGVGAVIHVHLHDLWMRLLHQVPTTREEVSYGTPEMAAEVKRLLVEDDLQRTCLFAMAGHEDGLVVVGADLGRAMARLARARSLPD
jgi:ribulose-5-phosphate 4-epimerase/fuculose-1-phosphate aldolase